jgi:uncharacterized membrane-anchored protein
VDPLLLRSAFRLGFVILLLALVILPFEDRSSPEFVATVLAVIVGSIFVGIVVVLARSTLPPQPRPHERNSVDKATVKEYNDQDSRSGGDR